MILLVSGATATVPTFCSTAVGRLIVPGAWTRGPYDRLLEDGRPYAGDNGAFSGFDERAFLSMLERLRGHRGCLFVTAPDVVGDAAATRELFLRWTDRIRVDFPVALVAQNGLTAARVPWLDCDAIFLGGSLECVACVWVRPKDDRKTARCPTCRRRLTEYKLGAAAREIAEEARRRGLWTHMGRVNSRGRIRYARTIGIRSIDGSSYSKFAKRRIPEAVEWIAADRAQPRMF